MDFTQTVGNNESLTKTFNPASQDGDAIVIHDDDDDDVTKTDR